MNKALDRMIVALDFSSLEEAKNFVEKMGGNVSFYKVGLELFLNSKGEIIDFLKAKNKKIFLDLKFHDIPNTVAMAGKFASMQDVEIFNVHASGGKKMMEEVLKIGKKQNPNSLIIAVTVLTSLGEEDVNEVFNSKFELGELVLNLARLTKESGLDGVVSSPWEARKIKEICGEDFKTVCPGVRPSFASSNDQKRVMTPYEAIKNGCDYLVIGRPITRAEDPILASKLIVEEIAKAMGEI